jgi:hypothetical protein
LGGFADDCRDVSREIGWNGYYACRSDDVAGFEGKRHRYVPDTHNLRAAGFIRDVEHRVAVVVADQYLACHVESVANALRNGTRRDICAVRKQRGKNETGKHVGIVPKIRC